MLSRRSSHPPFPCWPLLPWKEGDPHRSPPGPPRAHLPGRRRRLELSSIHPCPAGYHCPFPGEMLPPGQMLRALKRRGPCSIPHLSDAFPPASLPLKATCVLQATGVQVVRVPFFVHWVPFGQSQGQHHGKTVSSVSLVTTAQRLSRKAMQTCLQSHAELDLSALQVSLPALPLQERPYPVPMPSPLRLSTKHIT